MRITSNQKESYFFYREQQDKRSLELDLPNSIQVSFSLVKVTTQELVNNVWTDVDVQYQYELVGYDTSDWDDIVEHYSRLVHEEPSPVNMQVLLNELLLTAEDESSSYVDEFKTLANSIEKDPTSSFNSLNH